MVDVEDRLAPMDGVSNFDVSLGAVFPTERATTFRFWIEERDKTGGIVNDNNVALSFDVFPGPDGLDGMYARAHELLIDALRQMLYRAEKGRRGHEKK